MEGSVSLLTRIVNFFGVLPSREGAFVAVCSSLPFAFLTFCFVLSAFVIASKATVSSAKPISSGSASANVSPSPSNSPGSIASSSLTMSLV